MNIGELLYQCDIEAKHIFWKVEKINKKIIDAKWSRTFNEVCAKFSILLIATFKVHFKCSRACFTRRIASPSTWNAARSDVQEYFSSGDWEFFVRQSQDLAKWKSWKLLSWLLEPFLRSTRYRSQRIWKLCRKGRKTKIKLSWTLFLPYLLYGEEMF